MHGAGQINRGQLIEEQDVVGLRKLQIWMISTQLSPVGINFEGRFGIDMLDGDPVPKTSSAS